ncbi:MAG TPA: hypothetical protein VK742_19570, partial [Candidatus Sulfotelmatobacter sp.]|nr:hypothetical protein [Candidatus Sulfotelmatobacter sp.]
PLASQCITASRLKLSLYLRRSSFGLRSFMFRGIFYPCLDSVNLKQPQTVATKSRGIRLNQGKSNQIKVEC